MPSVTSTGSLTASDRSWKKFTGQYPTKGHFDGLRDRRAETEEQRPKSRDRRAETEEQRPKSSVLPDRTLSLSKSLK